MSNKVLAVVEGKEITEEIVERFISELGPQLGMQFNSEEGKKRIVEELVNQELVYLEALDKGVDKDEDFLKELDRVKEGLLKQYSVNKLLEDVKISEENIKDYYENNKEIFRKPETVVASHILVDNEEKAKEIKKEIEEGLDFSKAAADNSSCPSNQAGGNLGEFSKGQMVPEFEEVAFSLEPGIISDPVKTDHGYHIILVNEKNESKIAPYDEVSHQIMQQLLGMKQQEKYIEETNKLKEKFKVEIKE